MDLGPFRRRPRGKGPLGRTVAHYDRTADSYDAVHGGERDAEHILALERAWPLLEALSIGSVVDVGCGSGRSLSWLGARRPSLRLLGVDPSRGLLQRARTRLPRAALALGDGERLPLADGAADLVMASGILHHVRTPKAVIREMFRVTRRAVLISDHNNFAFGSSLARRLRLGLYTLKLLPAATFVKQGFRSQGYTDDDGWWYPYSVLDNYGVIAALAGALYLIPTRPPNSDRFDNLLLAQSHIAVVATKADGAGCGSAI